MSDSQAYKVAVSSDIYKVTWHTTTLQCIHLQVIILFETSSGLPNLLKNGQNYCCPDFITFPYSFYLKIGIGNVPLSFPYHF